MHEKGETFRGKKICRQKFLSSTFCDYFPEYLSMTIPESRNRSSWY